MFGFSFWELVVVVLVAILVIGPKDLPKVLRRLGQYAGKLRRAAADLRAQSGIDDALRSEGLADDINEIRKLARGELDGVRRLAEVDSKPAAATAPNPDPYARPDDFWVVRDREYPRDGCDAYNALPDNAIVYVETLPKSALARDPLYVLGDPDGVLPPEEPKPATEDESSPGETSTGDASTEDAGAAAPDAEASPAAPEDAPPPPEATGDKPEPPAVTSEAP